MAAFLTVQLDTVTVLSALLVFSVRLLYALEAETVMELAHVTTEFVLATALILVLIAHVEHLEIVSTGVPEIVLLDFAIVHLNTTVISVNLWSV